MLLPANPPSCAATTVIEIAAARLVCPAVLSPIQTAIQGERQYNPPAARETPM